MTNGAQDPVAWWDEHGPEVRDRWGHVEQKLDQLGLVTAALRRLDGQLSQLRDWLAGLRLGPDGLRDIRVLLDPTFFVRLAAAGLFLRHELTNLDLLGGSSATPSAAGASGPAAPVDTTDVQAAERAAFAEQVAQILDAGSPWAGGAFADVMQQFGVVGKIERGLGWFVAGELWDLITSPYQTYQEHKFTHLGFDALEEFMDQYGSDLDEMSRAFQDAVNALDRVDRALDGARLDSPASTLGGQAAQDLRSVADEYTRIRDAVPQPPTPEGDDFEARFERWYEQYRQFQSGLEEEG